MRGFPLHAGVPLSSELCGARSRGMLLYHAHHGDAPQPSELLVLVFKLLFYKSDSLDDINTGTAVYAIIRRHVWIGNLLDSFINWS